MSDVALSDFILYLVNNVMRVLVITLPVSLKSFSFNEDSLVEAHEAINATGSKFLLVWWAPSTVANLCTAASLQGHGSIRILPLLILVGSCLGLSLALWKLSSQPMRPRVKWVGKLVNVDALRSDRSARTVVVLLFALDIVVYFTVQGPAVQWLMPASLPLRIG